MISEPYEVGTGEPEPYCGVLQKFVFQPTRSPGFD